MTPDGDPTRRVTVLSTANWYETNWTNKQHLSVQLSTLFGIDYVESFGLRRPKLSTKDLKRVLARVSGKLHSGSKARERIPSGIEVYSPLVLPFHQNALARRINVQIVRRLLAELTSRHGAHSRILWTFSPLTYGLERGHRGVVYHSVDLTHEFPGIPRRVFLKAERQLIGRADVVIASSTAVAEHLKSQGARDPLLWENVADSASIIQGSSADPDLPPRAVFVGNISSAKLDFRLVAEIAASGLIATVDLYGPIPGGDLVAQRFIRSQHGSIRYMGVANREDLGQIMSRYSVGLIPYAENPYTAGVYPMKIYEYMAAGIPVLYSGLPSVTPSDDLRRVVSGNIADSLRWAVNDRVNGSGRRKDVASVHSWAGRGQQAIAVVQSLIPEI